MSELSSSVGNPSMDQEEEEEEQVENKLDHPDDELEDVVDLKNMADDYAKYLVVNSKQDVSFQG